MLRNLNSYLTEQGVIVNESTVEQWVDQAVESTKNAEEAIKWIAKQKDSFVQKNEQKIIDMIKKMPKSLFASEQLPDDKKITETEDEIDWDTVDEYYDDDEEPIDEDDAEEVDEAIMRKRVVRGGKIMMKKKTNKAGYKMKGGKEVKMSSVEMIKRRRASMLAARKRKGKQGMMQKKRQRSIMKRTW